MHSVCTTQNVLLLQLNAVRQTQRSIGNECTSAVPKCKKPVGVIQAWSSVLMRVSLYQKYVINDMQSLYDHILFQTACCKMLDPIDFSMVRVFIRFQAALKHWPLLNVLTNIVRILSNKFHLTGSLAGRVGNYGTFRDVRSNAQYFLKLFYVKPHSRHCCSNNLFCSVLYTPLSYASEIIL